MKNFATRYPLAFSLLLTLALFGLLFASRVALPTEVVSSVTDLPPEVLLQPSPREQFLSAIESSENLFQALAILLAVLLITALGWWHRIGFNRPSQWRNLRLLLFPLLVGALSFLGGLEVTAPALFFPTLLGLLLAVFSEEVLYRGILWRVLVPTGVVGAVILTSLLYGTLYLVKLGSARPWPEAVYLTVLATCAGFTYAALRWRTASIWPVLALHFVLKLFGEISTPESVPSLVLLLVFASTLGFIGYGLFLLRNPRVQKDGGATAQEQARTR
ncbi:MAG: CPBP family intramembrane metalloprotease [Actinomycetota bacterium]|nr:CPBP family intramembrane metalloprotease [Actinomycetota bacterium]